MPQKMETEEEAMKHREELESKTPEELGEMQLASRNDVFEKLADIADRLDKRIKQNEYPDHTQQVKYQMCPSCSLSIKVRDKCRHICSNCRANIFAQHHGGSHIKWYPAFKTHKQGYRHGGAGRLHYQGQDSTDKQKQ